MVRVGGGWDTLQNYLIKHENIIKAAATETLREQSMSRHSNYSNLTNKNIRGRSTAPQSGRNSSLQNRSFSKERSSSNLRQSNTYISDQQESNYTANNYNHLDNSRSVSRNQLVRSIGKYLKLFYTL